MKMTSVLAAAILTAMSSTSTMAVTVDLTGPHYLTSAYDTDEGLASIVNMGNTVSGTTDTGKVNAGTEFDDYFLMNTELAAGVSVLVGGGVNTDLRLDASDRVDASSLFTARTEEEISSVNGIDYNGIINHINYQYLGGSLTLPNTISDAFSEAKTDPTSAGNNAIGKAFNHLNTHHADLVTLFNGYQNPDVNTPWGSVDRQATVVMNIITAVNDTLDRFDAVIEEIENQRDNAITTAASDITDAVNGRDIAPFQ